MSYICYDCPRKCGAERNENEGFGYCKSPSLPTVVRAAPHFGEEPCISGVKGSGAIFFSGCNLRCVFCQNCEISRTPEGKRVSTLELRDIILRLRDTGVHNINLVTGTHYTASIAEALSSISLGIPVVWNSSGYESLETLRLLEGLVNVYLPDYKYYKSQIAGKYSNAPDYPETALEAIREMYRQTGPYVLDSDGMLVSGVMIRHLILPDNELNSMDVIDSVAENFEPGTVLFSLMSQYTPNGKTTIPELNKRVTPEINSNMISYMLKRGIDNGYWQETESSTDELLPKFDMTGV